MLFLEKRALHGTWTRDSTGVSVPEFDKMPLAVSGQGRALVAVFCSGTCSECLYWVLVGYAVFGLYLLGHQAMLCSA